MKDEDRAFLEAGVSPLPQCVRTFNEPEP